MLDRNGYKRKTFEELVEEMINRAKQLFGENINTSERSVIGILIRIMAWFLSLLWKDNEDVYYSAYPNTATGVQLDRISPYGGITRELATYSYGPINLKGTPGYTVDPGFLLATKSDIFFETIESITIGDDGIGSGEIRSLEVGRIGNVAANSVDTIVNPDSEIDSAINPEPITGGREKETDQEFRERFSLSVEGLGSGTPAAIKKNVRDVENVRAAEVINNYSGSVDEYGTPDRAFQTFVLGGRDEDVAQAILDSKPAGIQPYGEIYVMAIDDSGNEQKIGFSRAVQVPIHVKLTVTKNNAYPLTGDEQMRSALVRYIGGEDADAVFYAGLNMGEDVIYSRLFSTVFSISGVDDVVIELSKDGKTYQTGNVDIDRQEVAQTSYENIEVIHVV